MFILQIGQVMADEYYSTTHSWKNNIMKININSYSFYVNKDNIKSLIDWKYQYPKVNWY